MVLFVHLLFKLYLFIPRSFAFKTMQRDADTYKYDDRCGNELRSMRAGEKEVTYNPSVFNFLLDYCTTHLTELNAVARALKIEEIADFYLYTIPQLTQQGASSKAIGALHEGLRDYVATLKAVPRPLSRLEEAVIAHATTQLAQGTGRENDYSNYCFENKNGRGRKIVRLKNYSVKRESPHVLVVNGVVIERNDRNGTLAPKDRPRQKRAQLTLDELESLFSSYQKGINAQEIKERLHVSEGCVRYYLRLAGITPSQEESSHIYAFLKGRR